MASDPEPSLDWVAQAAALVAEPGATIADVARWAGAVAPRGDEVAVEEPDAIPGALEVLISGEDGRPEAVSAIYAPGAGPALDDTILALGAWFEFERPAPGPYQGAFSGGAPRGWEAVGTLSEPPGTAVRLLVEIALVRA